jgi:hypothetical protein
LGQGGKQAKIAVKKVFKKVNKFCEVEDFIRWALEFIEGLCYSERTSLIALWRTK